MSGDPSQDGQPVNPVVENIKKRRSIRRYRPDPVPDDMVRTVLDAANYAPSAHNKQSWKFVVVRGESRLGLSRLIQGESARFPRKVRILLRLASQIIKSAPLVVAIFNTGELMKELGVESGREIDDFFRLMEIQSTSAAVQNLMLAASSMGLGTVWLGAVYLIKEEIATFLDQEGELMAVVPMGFPADKPKGPPRRKDLDEVAIY